MVKIGLLNCGRCPNGQPKRGMYCRIFFLDKVRVSNPQQFTHTQILVQTPPPGLQHFRNN